MGHEQKSAKTFDSYLTECSIISFDSDSFLE